MRDGWMCGEACVRGGRKAKITRVKEALRETLGVHACRGCRGNDTAAGLGSESSDNKRPAAQRPWSREALYFLLSACSCTHS